MIVSILTTTKSNRLRLTRLSLLIRTRIVHGVICAENIVRGETYKCPRIHNPLYKMRIILYILLWMGDTLAREVDYCFVNEPEPYLNFGVKTPYRFVANGKFERIVIPNCEPVQVWMLARHGTRYPQEGAVDRLEELPTIRWKIMHSHENGESHLCDEDVERIKRWYPNAHLTMKYATKMTDEGWREGEELGRRLKDAYPELFPSSIEDIDSDNYVFRSITASRSILSLEALMKGLFSHEYGAPKAVKTVKEDRLLRPDRHCHQWSHADRKTEVQRDEFIHGPEYAQLQRNVSRRIGFYVSPETIHNIQDMCRFETAWTRGKISPWCAVFSKEEWKIMEYIDDIQYYYYSGYGVPLNTVLGCFPAEDFINQFRQVEHSKAHETPRGIFYMSTSRVLMDFLHTLGIAKDSQHLLSNNYKQMKDRKWRTSLIAPFFANFIATFYRCNGPNQSHKITFHLNEKLIMYEGCDGGICDWHYLEEKVGREAYKCEEKCLSDKPIEIPSDLLEEVFSEPVGTQSNFSNNVPKDEQSIFLLIIALCILMIIFHKGIARTLSRMIRCNW